MTVLAPVRVALSRVEAAASLGMSVDSWASENAERIEAER
jgi:hypothetical protein